MADFQFDKSKVKTLPNVTIKDVGVLDPFQMLEQGILTPESFIKQYPNLLYEYQDQMIEQGLLSMDTDVAGILDRAKASIKMTDIGEQGFIESIYGEGNVFRDEKGQLHVRSGEGSAYLPFDEKGYYDYIGKQPDGFLKDAADTTGFLIETIPSFVVGAVTANPYAAGAAAATGNLIRQGLSATLPGDDAMTAYDRVESAVTYGVFGYGGQKVSNWLVDFGMNLNPKYFVKNLASKKAIKAQLSDEEIADLPIETQNQIIKLRNELIETEDLEEIGPLTLGEASSDKILLKIEKLLRTYYLSEDIAVPLQEEQVSSVAKAIQNFLVKTVKADDSKQAFLGQEIVDAYNNVVTKLINQRATRANKAYSEFAKKPTIINGEEVIVDNSAVPVIEVNETLGQIKKFIDDYQSGGFVDESYLDGLFKLQDKIAEMSVLDPETGLRFITPKQANQFLQDYSQAAAGKGKLLTDVDTAATRRPARLLLDALGKDLDNTATRIGEQGGQYSKDMVDAVLAFRQSYKDDSKMINYFQNSFLKQFVDPATATSSEKIATKFANLDPSQFDVAIKFLRSEDPSVIQNLKAEIIADAYENSLYPVKLKTSPGQVGVGDELSKTEKGGLGINKKLDPEKFKTNIDNSLGNQKAEILFGDGELKEIQNIMKYIEKVNFTDVEKSGVSLDIAIAFQNLKGFIGRYAGFRWLANQLMTKEGRLGLQEFVDLAAGRKKKVDLTKGELQAVFNMINNYYGAQGYVQEKIPDIMEEGEFSKAAKETEPPIPKITAPDYGSVLPPAVSRGQGEVLPPLGDQASLSGPMNPQTLSSLESVGMPLFQAKEGGLASLDTKDFKKPQVVA